jgi:hypothetical protein
MFIGDVVRLGLRDSTKHVGQGLLFCDRKYQVIRIWSKVKLDTKKLLLRKNPLCQFTGVIRGIVVREHSEPV